MKRFVTGVFCLLVAATAAGCNTVQGFGTDLQKGGEAIKRAATPKSATDSMYQ